MIFSTKKNTLQEVNTFRHLTYKYQYVLKKSTRRRTLVISVDECGQVSVYAPMRMKDEIINNFLREKSEWVIKKSGEARNRRKVVEHKQFENGHQFYFLGKKHELTVVETSQKRPEITFDGSKWTVTISDKSLKTDRQSKIKKILIKWYRQQAEEILGSRLFHYSRIMGVEPLKIAIRQQKRIWGNCDFRTKTIHLNWQIIFAPIAVIDYVIVHELCHLWVPNHSRKFWEKVAKFLPDYKRYQLWLKQHQHEMILSG